MWRESFTQVKTFRSELKRSDGILLKAEFHATAFVSGRGRLGPREVFKRRRREIFFETLRLITGLPGASLTNALGRRKAEDTVFERLLNRVHRTAESEGDHALVLCDKGKEKAFTRLARRMSKHNPIPSNRGEWEDGTQVRNLPIDRIVEDIVFKDSANSYFIQLVDFCAYALLRRESPLESKSRVGLDRAFAELDPILNRKACRNDREGIVRVR